jgi:putative ABC transport system ATP-binding protein
MSTALLAAERIGRNYPRERCVALSDVSLAIAPGEYAAVTGPSGSGKSTLLHLLSGLDRPTSGRVLFDGRQPAGTGEWASIRARNIGFVFQSFHLLPTLTARQNVEVPMMGVVAGVRDRRRRAEELLARVGLADRAGHRPSQLSGGEKQRLAIARSLANSPAVILADEPTGNLDSKSAAGVLDLREALRREEGALLVIVTHDPDIAGRAERRISLQDGRMVADERAAGRG